MMPAVSVLAFHAMDKVERSAQKPARILCVTASFLSYKALTPEHSIHHRGAVEWR
jgi:hypothetical protein